MRAQAVAVVKPAPVDSLVREKSRSATRADQPNVRCGAEDQSRTGDTTIFSRVLYQLSYLGTNPIVSAPPIGGNRYSFATRRAGAAILPTIA